MTPTCLGKIGYAERSEAVEARARVIRRRKEANSDPIDIYHCPNCKRFHLGRNPKKARKGQFQKVRADWKSKLNRYLELTGGKA